MVVYFLRHADAEPDAENDFARQLTVKGLEQAEKTGKFCLRNGLRPDLIITSPVTRAQQTARIVATKLGNPDLVEEHWLACGMTPDRCLMELRAFAHLSTIMLVGHEPDFGETIAAIVGLPDADGLNIRKSSLSAVDLPDFHPACGSLQFLVPARLM